MAHRTKGIGVSLELSYIIPVSNGGRPDFAVRCRNLQFIYDSFIMKQKEVQFEVIFVEQTVSRQFPHYAKNIRIDKDNTRFIHISWPVFNKGWCINVGARAAQSPVIVVAEADCFSIDGTYFFSILNNFLSGEHKWAFGWDALQYLSQYESMQIMRGDQIAPRGRRYRPYSGGPEGGILVYNRGWYLKIGGHNEFVQGLGGPDNEMADRAKWWSKSYTKLNADILHLWHPQVKGSYRRDGHRVYNKQIIKLQRNYMANIAPRIAKTTIGDPNKPACGKKTYVQMRSGK